MRAAVLEDRGSDGGTATVSWRGRSAEPASGARFFDRGWSGAFPRGFATHRSETHSPPIRVTRFVTCGPKFDTYAPEDRGRAFPPPGPSPRVGLEAASSNKPVQATSHTATAENSDCPPKYWRAAVAVATPTGATEDGESPRPDQSGGGGAETEIVGRVEGTGHGRRTCACASTHSCPCGYL